MTSGVYIRSKSTKEKISKWHKGRKLSEKHRKKISAGLQLAIKEGRRKSMVGSGNHAWRGGISLNDGYKDKRKKFYGTVGSHTNGEWELLKKQYGYTCPSCGIGEPETKLTEDHIIPLSKGGSDYIENIQPLCKMCNCKKYNKVIAFRRKDV